MANPKHRMTKQRKLILEVLRSTDSHPTADWIYEQVKKKFPISVLVQSIETYGY